MTPSRVSRTPHNSSIRHAAQDQMVRALRARGLALKEQLGVLEVDSSRGHLLPSARQWRLSAALRSGRSFVCGMTLFVTRLTCMCDMTHLCVRHDIFAAVCAAVASLRSAPLM